MPTPLRERPARAEESHRQTATQGFSVLELMIALVIMAVITSQMFVMLSAQQRGFRGEARSLDLQETTRLVLDLIAFDARNAGMLVPRQAAIASTDGGMTGNDPRQNPDRLCLSDGSFFPIPAPGVSDPFWDNLGDRFPGAELAAAGGSTPADLRLQSNDIDGQGGLNDFTTDAGVIIARADGQEAHCARIVDTAVGQVRIDDPVPFALNNLIIVPAILYEIAGNALQRNGIAISTNIEDLQVEYWVDASIAPNGVVDPAEWPIDELGLNGLRGGGSTAWMDTSRIRRVQISVVGISPTPDEGLNGRVSPKHRYPGVANRDQGAAVDSFPRKVFTASVLPRNLLNPGEIPNLP